MSILSEMKKKDLAYGEKRREGIRPSEEVAYAHWRVCQSCFYEGPMDLGFMRDKCPECGDEKEEHRKMMVPFGCLLVDRGELQC